MAVSDTVDSPERALTVTVAVASAAAGAATSTLAPSTNTAAVRRNLRAANKITILTEPLRKTFWKRSPARGKHRGHDSVNQRNCRKDGQR
ncbi:hypothetical protein GCM10018954_071940 [Kutzneria kofuensis]